MAFQGKWDVYRITQWKNGCVYKTMYLTTIWLDVKPRTVEEMNNIAVKHGGDQLVATIETRIT
jgi:hypothetical protein